MQKNAGALPRGKATATPSRKTPGVRRSFLVASCHSTRKEISVPLWIDQTEITLALGSGQTGRVIIWPLRGIGIGANASQALSDGCEGISPSRKYERMTIPWLLTMGISNHPNTRAVSTIPTPVAIKERGQFWRDLTPYLSGQGHHPKSH